ncbi:MAG: PAS domain S-box protein [Methylocystaceae bacterium]
MDRLIVFVLMAMIAVALAVVSLQAILFSRNRYPSWLEAQLLDNVFAGIFRSTVEGRFVMANNAFLKLLQVDSLEQLNQRKAYEYYKNPDDRYGVIEDVRKHGMTIWYGVAFERPSGEEIWVDLHFKGSFDRKGNLVSMQGIVVDVTERKKVEQMLRESEQRYRLLSELSQDGIFIYDGTRFTYANQNMNKFSGRENMVGLTLDDLFDYRQQHAIRSNYTSGKTRGVMPERWEIKMVWPDGSTHYGDVASATYREGENFYVQGSIRDITIRRDMERELYVQAALLNNAGETAIVSDYLGRVRYINRTATLMTGYEREEIVGKPAGILVAREDRHLLYQMRSQAVETGRAELEMRIRSRSGQINTCEVTTVRITGLEGDGELYMSLLRDVSPLKLALKELAQANRYMEELNRRLSQNQEEAHQLLEMQFPLQPLVTQRYRLEQVHRLSSTVGGDIVGYEYLKPGYISFYLIDASGHGLSSAMEACAARKLLLSTELAPYRLSPEELLLQFDNLFKQNRFFPEDYVAIMYGFIDETAGVVTYATMGMQNQPVLLNNRNTADFMPSGGIPSFGNLPPRVVGHQLRLEPGERLVVYSDGFLEATNHHGEQYGYERLSYLLNGHNDSEVDAIADELFAAISDFTNQPLPDDDCSLMIITADRYPKGQLFTSWEEKLVVGEIYTIASRVEQIVARVKNLWMSNLEVERHHTLLLELLTNAIIHGCLGIHEAKGQPEFEEQLAQALLEHNSFDKCARIRIEVYSMLVRYVITDTGKGFCYDNLADWRFDKPEDLRTSHLGLKLIKLLADELRVYPPGNKVEIVVYRDENGMVMPTPINQVKRILV